MKSIIIASEDTYGCKFFKDVAHRINPQVNVKCFMAGAWNPKKVRIFLSANADLLIDCVDADGEDTNKITNEQYDLFKKNIKTHFSTRILKKLKVVVFKHEVEEWIIFSKNLKLSGNKPSEILKKKMKYEKWKLPEFASTIDFDVLEQKRVRSFIEFKQAVNDP